MSDELKKLSMSELIARYNEVAVTKGASPVTEFKNLAAARAAVSHIKGKTMTDEVQSTDAQNATDGSKYSTVGKRGPNQGIGEFAKGLLQEGLGTAEVLAKVLEQFPTAKTSASCIAYYKAALKNPNLGKRKTVIDPAILRAKAEALLAQAAAAEQAAIATEVPQE